MALAQTPAQKAGTLVLGTIASSAVDALTPVFIVRLFTQTEVGLWATVMLSYQTLATVLTGGFPRTALYVLAGRPPAERRAIARKLFFILLGLGVMGAAVLAGIALLGALGMDPTSKGDIAPPPVLYAWLAAYPVFDVPSRLLPNVLMAEGRARSSAGTGIARSLANGVAVLLPAALGFGVVGVIFGSVIVGALHFLWLLASLRYLYGPAAPVTGTEPSVRELVKLSVPVGVTDVVNVLNARLDMWLVVAFLPATAVAEYKIGAWQIPILTTVAYSTGTSYLPELAELFRKGARDEALRIWRESIQKVSLIVVPAAAVFVIAAPEFVTIAFGPAYERSAEVFRCYSVLTLARVTSYATPMLAAGRPEFVLRSAALTLVANFVLSLPLVLTVGFVGPALGTVLAFVPTMYFYCLYIARAFDVSIRNTFPLGAYARVVAVTAAPCALAVLFKEAVHIPAAAAFAVEALIILGGFSVLGSVVQLISKEDWRFAADWARLRVLR